SARHTVADVAGAPPWAKTPSFKPGFREKGKKLEANESKTHPVFYCAKPRGPRIGLPRKIIPLSKKTIFLYRDLAWDTYRVMPIYGRKHNLRANPSYYGDAIGYWEKDTLVVDTTNFVEDTWFGEDGYFHSDKLHVIERLWLTPENNLAYQVTVDDPGVLT